MRQNGEAIRLIPACAGTTSRARHVRLAPAAHPRVRGDHGWCSLYWSRTFWLIPACAGTTGSAGPARARLAAHPRVRGDHVHMAGVAGVAGGSSPRARGPLPPASRNAAQTRLIPACAGTTATQPKHWGPEPAHPRVRGDHVRHRGSELKLDGSSPRARGPRWWLSARAVVIAAHPRVRGDHIAMIASTALSVGSSPRARGPHRARAPDPDRRLIPACAGTTLPGTH